MPHVVYFFYDQCCNCSWLYKRKKKTYHSLAAKSYPILFYLKREGELAHFCQLVLIGITQFKQNIYFEGASVGTMGSLYNIMENDSAKLNVGLKTMPIDFVTSRMVPKSSEHN